MQRNKNSTMNNYNRLAPTLLLAVLLWSVTAPSSAARPSLAARLKVESGGNDSSASALANCWDSLIELQACTGEVIMFFLNGETYLGPTCCQAIRVIGQHCWPAMFGAIEFTAEEADVLQGFCDAAVDPRSPPPQSSQPAIAPQSVSH